MKKIMIVPILLALLGMNACNVSQQKSEDTTGAETPDSTAAFEAFCEHFSSSSAFACTEMDGRKILLVSQETFGNDEDSDREAIEASIFALDEEDHIVPLGSIRSQGTLYPVSMLEGRLMVAGHRFVRIYSIRGENPELVLESYEEGENPELTEMFRTFEKGTPVKFDKKFNHNTIKQL